MNKEKSVWIISMGTYYEGSSIIGITKSSVYAKVIKEEFKRNSFLYDKDINYITIKRYTIDWIDISYFDVDIWKDIL